MIRDALGAAGVKLLAEEKRIVATLEEVARRAVRNATATDQAVAELHRVSSDPVLLGVSAGRSAGRWTAIPLFHSIGKEVTDLLVAAGADADVFAMTAASVERRLGRHLRRG